MSQLPALFAPSMLAAVAVGGAVGAVARLVAAAIVAHWLGPAFPFGTLVVNVAGSFVMGVLAEAGALAWQPSPELRAMLATGFLGAFTTFSTFSLDVAGLIGRGEGAMAAVYVGASVALSIGALFAGMHVVKVVTG